MRTALDGVPADMQFVGRCLRLNLKTTQMTSVHPKKLLLSKWTAIKPTARQKHFFVLKVIPPEIPGGKIEWIEIEAVYTKRTKRLNWRELQDESIWRQGWK